MKIVTFFKLFCLCAMTLSVRMVAGQATYAENFDLADNWSGGAAGSYTAKTYVNLSDPVNDLFSSDAAVRESTNALEGYAWRLRNEGAPYFLYECEEVIAGFSVYMAHWNPAVSMVLLLEYSADGGASYVPLATLDESWWTGQGYGEKEYREFSQADLNIAPLPGEKACIRISTDGGERLLIDNFQLFYDNGPAGVEAPQEFNAVAASENEIHLTFVPNIANDDVVIVFDADGSFGAPVGLPPVLGEAFAGGTLFYVGTESPQVHSGLSAGETVHYMAWSYDGISYSQGLTATATTASLSGSPVAWINEFHYDNDGTDVSEFVEVVVRDAGMIDLAGLQLFLYNGSTGEYYASQTADNFEPGAAAGDYSIHTWYYPGIQNGAPEGLALAYEGMLISGQFLSYEGTFTGTNGPAAGELSVDVGVEEPSNSPVGYSLQLAGTGIHYDHFSWTDPAPETPGEVNGQQEIGGFTAWTGALSDNWHEPGNWDNGIPGPAINALVPLLTTTDPVYPVINAFAETGDLLIEVGADVDVGVSGALTVEGSSAGGGTLRIHSDESGSGSVITAGGPPAIVERYIVPGQWHYVASPVPEISSDIFEGMYLMTWDEPTETWVFIEEMGVPLNAGLTGYGLWADSPAVAEFPGILNAGAFSIPVFNTPGTASPENDPSGYNLVGNPYPSSLDWDAEEGAGWIRTSTNVGMAIYFWNGSQYASYVKGGPNPGPNGGTNIIPPQQGFFVMCLSEEGGSITVDDAARVHSSQPFYKDRQMTADLARIRVDGGLHKDELFFYIRPDATFGFDGQFDAFKLFGCEEAPQIYVLSPDSFRLSINCVPGTGEELIFGLGFRTGTEGIYKLELDDTGMFTQGPVILEDTYLQKYIDLHGDPGYEFHSFAGVFDDRFRLRFFAEEIPVLHGSSIAATPYVFSRQGKVVVRSNGPMHGEAMVCDILGRTLGILSLGGQEEAEIPLHGRTGWFVVRIRTEMGLQTHKLYLGGQGSAGE